MKPITALTNQLSILLAADTGTLAPTPANKLALVIAPFNPNLSLLIGDLQLSQAAGLAPLAGVAGAQNESVDLLSGELVIEIKPPAGGFRWETPAGFVGNTTIYGFALINDVGLALLGSETLPVPLILTGPNQAVIAPPITFRIDPTKVY